MSMSNLAPIPELYVSSESAQKLKAEAANLPSLGSRPAPDLRPRTADERRFLPAQGVPDRGGLQRRGREHAPVDGALWPMPITLDVSEKFAETIEPGQDIALRDQEGVILAILSVTDKWEPNKAREAEKVFGADDLAHPAVNYLHNTAGTVYLGGPVTGIQQPVHYDFKGRRDTPNELRAYFRKLGWRRIVAFQTRNPLHRAHQELTFRAAREAQANLLIHPVVGMTKPGDVDHFTRVRCYEAVLDKYPAVDHHDEPAEPGHAHGRPARGAVARADPQEPRLHPFHRRPRPCRPRQEQRRRGFLRPLRRAGAGAQAPGRDRHRDGRFQAYGLCPGTRPVRARRRDRGRRDRAEHLGHRAAPPPVPRGWKSPTGSRSPRWWRSCARPARRAPSRASRCSSPASPARASRPSPTR